MSPNPLATFATALLVAVTWPVATAWTQDKLLRDLPPGIAVISTTDAAPDQTQAIGQKLGGAIRKLSNNQLVVHGATIKVNVITAKDASAADAIEKSLAAMKSQPFLWRDGNRVVEFVTAPGSEALGWKTAWELGLAPKPGQVTWRLEAELGLVDDADYMTLNPLFNAFLTQQAGRDPAADERIAALSMGVRGGNELRIRRVSDEASSIQAEFEPAPASQADSGCHSVLTFERPLTRAGVPYVTADLAGSANSQGFTQAVAPDEALIASTAWWPIEDQEIAKLAASIAKGADGPDEKATAILEWLAPGRNIRYDGETGSRYGVAKVLEQKFGHCWDFADVFVTLARAAGVPSRQVAGWLYGSSGHVWAEYYSEGGWQQVDPTGGGKLACGIYHIAYFTTEDGEMPILYLSMPKLELKPAKD
jgi:Transglutaminase-like superfamily